jgi:hypothetical protein
MLFADKVGFFRLLYKNLGGMLPGPIGQWYFVKSKHLRYVHVTVSDMKLAVNLSSNSTIDYCDPDTISAKNYPLG